MRKSNQEINFLLLTFQKTAENVLWQTSDNLLIAGKQQTTRQLHQPFRQSALPPVTIFWQPPWQALLNKKASDQLMTTIWQPLDNPPITSRKQASTFHNGDGGSSTWPHMFCVQQIFLYVVEPAWAHPHTHWRKTSCVPYLWTNVCTKVQPHQAYAIPYWSVFFVC